MKALLAASAALFVIAGSLPATAAPDYPWCQRSRATGGNPQCSFTSFQQCQATVSGIGGDCIQNPMMAYGRYQQRPNRNQSRAMRDPNRAPHDGGWDNGWDRGRW